MPELPHQILIADDHEENRYILNRILRAAGYQCAEAATGAQALQCAQAQQPALIILDVRLPDMSGFDVCKQLKSDPRTASIPVLQISAAFVSSDDRVRALDGGADGYLTHPIDRTVLTATVRSLLRLRIAELEARQSAQQWESTFDGLSEGLAILEEGYRLVRWNAAFEAICESSFRPEIGKDVSGFLDQLTGLAVSSREETQQRFSAEFALDGRTMQLSLSPIATGRGNHESIVILSDLTDRRLAEYAIRTAEKLAATGKLANAIAHEINNPLEAMINLIFLARASKEMEFVQEMLGRASQELDRIARITKQTLAFHRDTQHPVPVDLGQLMADVVALYERPSLQRRIRLVLDARPAPPVLGFAGQLGQVFANLLRNATEAAPADSMVTVRVRPTHRSGHAGARVTIHDRGCGIPPAVRQKIFDPFFTTKELKGSGLGLWVSKSLIARHHGAIRFRTSEQKGRSGTTFVVFLPADGVSSQTPSPLDRGLSARPA